MIISLPIIVSKPKITNSYWNLVIVSKIELIILIIIICNYFINFISFIDRDQKHDYNYLIM